MKCPFLEEVIVRYCKAYPLRKMIPSSGEESVCLGDEHCDCSTFREVARVDVAEEEIETPKAEYEEALAVRGTADYFPLNYPKICKVLNCPVCPFRFQCLGAERKWLREPVLIHGFAIRRDMHYAKWHTWAQIMQNKTVRIGIDDFSQNLLGSITAIEPPEIGKILKEKLPAWKMQTNGWSIDILSPIDGEVIDVNPTVCKDPSVLNRDPYKMGWVLEIQPDALEEKVELIPHGEDAISWFDSELDKLHQQIEEGVGTVIADGGELVDAIDEKVGRSEWKKLVSQFLMTEVHNSK